MAKNDAKNSLLDKEKRIKAEISKYNKILKEQGIDEDRKKAVEKLVQNVAFMAVTLEDLQAVVNEKGCTEEYQNGATQFGVKEATEIKVYNSLIRNYNMSMKQLLDQLPQAKEPEKDDGFDSFVNGK